MQFCIIEQDNDPANNLCFNLETEMNELLAEMRKRGIESLPVWYSPTDEYSPAAYKLAIVVNA